MELISQKWFEKLKEKSLLLATNFLIFNSTKQNKFLKMKLFNLYNKNVKIVYSHQLCSFATFFVLLTTLFALITPFSIIFSLNPNIWSKELTIFEQPDVKFKFQYLVLAETNERSVVTCSSFDFFNKKTEEFQKCSSIKVTTQYSWAESFFLYDLFPVFWRWLQLWQTNWWNEFSHRIWDGWKHNIQTYFSYSADGYPNKGLFFVLFWEPL